MSKIDESKTVRKISSPIRSADEEDDTISSNASLENNTPNAEDGGGGGDGGVDEDISGCTEVATVVGSPPNKWVP